MDEFEENFIPRITQSFHSDHYNYSGVIDKEAKHKIEKEVKALRKALGFISNKQTIVNVLCPKTNQQRVEIAKVYRSAYERDLIDDIKRKFSPKSQFTKLMVALLTPIHDFYCVELYGALNEAGIDDDCLVQILCTLCNHDMNEVCQRYVQIYGKTLEKDIRSDTNGNFRKLLLSFINAARDESMILDLYTARVDAMELKRSSNDKWGSDSGVFSRILSSRNFDQIRLIAQEYEYITGHSLEVDIKKEFTGEVLDALLSILRFATDSSEFFARCFHKAVMGKLDKALIRLIVTRSELDIEDIKEAYKKKYNNVLLKNDIKKKTKGNYQKALLKLIGE